MKTRKLAYFSAEVGISPSIKTYSGGLGILAGDTLKAMADVELPACGVTLLYREGFFKQRISEFDFQEELDDHWNYEILLEDTHKTSNVIILGQEVLFKIWKYTQIGITGEEVPVYFLDTNVVGNPAWAKELTSKLYVGDRLAQEMLLGLGGMNALRELGHYETIEKYHMNEGHSCFLTLDLYKELGDKFGYNDENVKDKCVFTTHTPIPAGHDKFSYDEIYKHFEGCKELLPWHLKELAGEDMFNTTKLCLSFSSYHNGVSVKHGEVSREMFPGVEIDAVTNGIHANSWTAPEIQKLYDSYIPGWRRDNELLRNVFKIPNTQLYLTHKQIKTNFVDYVNSENVSGARLDPNVLTIGFARRFIAYKDAELIFSNIEELKTLSGKVQFVFAGKAHKDDIQAKEIMQRVIQHAKELNSQVEIAFLPNYNMEMAKKMISGCDIWLNTPIPYNEASGTSGMKAAANGVIHFSRLDGWAIESFERNGGGFPITNYEDFMQTLKYKILPMFYSTNKTYWVEEMKLAIGNAASYFNTHRMIKEYIKKGYKF